MDRQLIKLAYQLGYKQALSFPSWDEVKEKANTAKRVAVEEGSALKQHASDYLKEMRARRNIKADPEAYITEKVRSFKNKKNRVVK